MNRPFTFYVESLGCAKNQVDSEEMIAALLEDGWDLAPGPESAGLIIVNSCGFIREAKEESIETALELKARFPASRMILAGCLTERYPDALRSELTEIDGFTGNRDPAEVVAVARRIVSAALLPPRRATAKQGAAGRARERLLSFPGSVYVKVAEGCDNRCSYCAIPLIRGELRSRTQDDVCREVRAFVERGIREVNLVAQDLGSYGIDRGAPELEALLERILATRGEFWLRLLYIHPDRFPPALLELIRGDARLLPYFDLPFQHASERILRAMGRKGSKAKYLGLVERIRSEEPRAVLRSTFLTGFPGEEESDVDEILDFQSRARLDWVGAFAYSREEDTPAAELGAQVKHSVSMKRKLRIERAQVAITASLLERFVGSRLDVLLEERVEGERMFLGRAYLQAPEVDGSMVVNVREGRGLPEAGEVVPVRVSSRNGFDLEGWVE